MENANNFVRNSAKDASATTVVLEGLAQFTRGIEYCWTEPKHLHVKEKTVGSQPVVILRNGLRRNVWWRKGHALSSSTVRDLPCCTQNTSMMSLLFASPLHSFVSEDPHTLGNIRNPIWHAHPRSQFIFYQNTQEWRNPNGKCARDQNPGLPDWHKCHLTVAQLLKEKKGLFRAFSLTVW